MIQTQKVFRILLGVLSLALVLVLAAAALPDGAQAAGTMAENNPDCAYKYTVRIGDTLNKIADKYDMKWSDLVRANHMLEPYAVYVGQSLCVPDLENIVKKGNQGKEGQSVAANFFVWRNGDTLSVYTLNFPKETFLVKVRDASYQDKGFDKIGLLKAPKGGQITETFQLPERFNKLSYITVCLKNQATDAVTCRAFGSKAK
jgi:LysM repeat protein